MFVADRHGQIIGLRAFMRWRFRAGGRAEPIRAVQSVDAATHPDYQRQGIFTRLTEQAVDNLRSTTDLIYNTPNEKSLPGNLKLGWQVVGRLSVRVQCPRPLRAIASARTTRIDRGGEKITASSAPLAAAAFANSGAVSDLLSTAGSAEKRISTDRDLQYLRWRYGSSAPFKYHVVTEGGSSGELAGMAIFRLRRRGRLREAAVTEVIVRPSSDGVGRHLLHEVIRRTPADHLVCSFARSTPGDRAASSTAALRIPIRRSLAVNRLNLDLEPDPTDRESWALTLGDLEIF
jgi:GNAT superfamily N-acetyltransferase